jgi:uncharacterized protein (DUF1684 family)
MGQILNSGSLLALVIVLVSCTSKQEDISADQHNALIDEWHVKRVESLKSPNGWLNLAGLFWLKEGINTFGAAETNDIVFPGGKIADQAGYFMLRNGMVTLEVQGESVINVKGEPVEKLVAWHPDSTSSAAPRMMHGSLLWFVIKRDDQYGIRLRDLEGEGVSQFHGIERYPVDLKWRLKARVEKAEPGKTIDITNVLGQTTANPHMGTLVFSIDGNEYRLDAIKESGPELFVIFGDPTNAQETYPSGRYIYVAPADESGMTILDFNKSQNPPCAFTAFATCPLPPRQNVLPVAITAGEKNYDAGHHPTPSK